ncbi:hypothetical protein C1646_771779 [Rhizophagus diaphanus]|nr:hypothetical protein C1646_771779 [Rhizophagus diaphanus] [Rhizophagus sp. MUCL 43196]
MKCVMKCNKKENWNHLFECQAYEVAWKKILEITTKESIIIYLKQKQIRGQGEDFIRKVLQNILEVTAKSGKFQKFQQINMETNARCEQVILWKKRSIFRTDKTTSESKEKDNSNQLLESKVKDNSNKLSNKVEDLQTGKIDRIQKSVSLVKKSMGTFVRKYIYEDWIPIKKKVDKVTLFMNKKLLD